MIEHIFKSIPENNIFLRKIPVKKEYRFDRHSFNKDFFCYYGEYSHFKFYDYPKFEKGLFSDAYWKEVRLGKEKNDFSYLRKNENRPFSFSLESELEFIKESLKLDISTERLRDYYRHLIFSSLRYFYYDNVRKNFQASKNFQNVYRNHWDKLLNYRLPRKIVGDRFSDVRIKTSSFELVDDGNGNLVDSSLLEISYDKLYARFTFDASYVARFNLRNVVFQNRAKNANDLFFFNCEGDFGVNGYAVKTKKSLGVLNYPYQLFYLNDDFSISFWIKADKNQSSLRGIANTIVEKFNGIGGYPFSVKILNQLAGESNGYLVVTRYDGKNAVLIQSTVPVNDNVWHNVIVMKKGNRLFLYVDGNLNDFVEDVELDNVHNESPIYFAYSYREGDFLKHLPYGWYIDGGTFETVPQQVYDYEFFSDFLNQNNSIPQDSEHDFYIIGGDFGTSGLERFARSRGDYFEGWIDEFYLYQRALTQEEISVLKSQPRIKEIGNLFYHSGDIVICDEKYFEELLNPSNDFELRVSSNFFIMEKEILVEVGAGDFNCSLNKTLLANRRNGDTIDNFKREDFAPYITAIGLYDDKFQLLAVAKLAIPIKKNFNYPITFSIKIDI